ncbi:MAG: chemotaxis protein CheD [Candidatus Sericytochromatia bacterium]|nr:chemotaxis protein CheD [Candidatus Sericytochromatia bacterium]
MASTVVTTDPSETLRIVGLGSCVAIVLRHVQVPLVGVGHFMLPRRALGVQDESDDKFVDAGLGAMVVKLARRAEHSMELEALLVGGSRMFRGLGAGAGIGRRNVQAATESLEEHGIPLVGGDVGGTLSRNLLVKACGREVSVALLGQAGAPLTAWFDREEPQT